MEMKIGFAVSLFLLSALKLLFTPIGAVLMPSQYPSLLEIALISSAGGAVGAIVFFFVGKGIDKISTKPRDPNKKIFTNKNRKIIRIKNKFGLIGMSLTIGIISVPIGAILVGKYFNTQKAAIPTLILSALAWGFAVTYITALFSRVIVPLFT